MYAVLICMQEDFMSIYSGRHADSETNWFSRSRARDAVQMHSLPQTWNQITMIFYQWVCYYWYLHWRGQIPWLRKKTRQQQPMHGTLRSPCQLVVLHNQTK
jgi:hypothetical protein